MNMLINSIFKIFWLCRRNAKRAEINRRTIDRHKCPFLLLIHERAVLYKSSDLIGFKSGKYFPINVSVKPLYLICLTSVFFVKFKNKVKMLSTSLGWSLSGRTVSFVLSTAWYPRRRAQFSRHGLPAWWITYNCSSVKLSNLASLNYVLERLKFLKGEKKTLFCSRTNFPNSAGLIEIDNRTALRCVSHCCISKFS